MVHESVGLFYGGDFVQNEVTANQVEILTAEILVLKNQTAANIIEIGKRLIKVKEMLPHGEWGKWLKERVEFSHRTANKFMQAAQMFGNSPPVANLGATKVFVLLEAPAEQRDELISKPQVIPSTGEAKTINEMTKRELEQVKKAMKDAEQARAALEKANEKMAELEERAEKERAARQSLEEEIERLRREGSPEARVKIAELERRLEKERETAAERETEIRKLREAMSSLEKRVKELENAPPKVVYKVDPALESELEAARDEADRYRRELEEMQKEKAAFEAMVAQLKKERAAPKRSLKDGSELRQTLERASSLARELGGVMDRLVKNHGSVLTALARDNAGDGDDLRDVAGKTVDSMAYTMFRLSLEFLSDRLVGLFDLLEEKPPKLAVLKGGKYGAEKA